MQTNVEINLDPNDADDATAIAEVIPDRPLASLYDLAYLLGKLHELESINRYDAPVKDKYFRRMTPETRPEYFDQAIGMVSVLVDLTEDDPTFGERSEVSGQPNDDIPFVAEPVDRDTLVRVGLSRQTDRASGYNMSLAHDTNVSESDVEDQINKLAKYLRKPFTTWAGSSPVESVAETHNQGWILSALARIGKDEEMLSAIEDKLETVANSSSNASVLTDLVTDGFNGVFSVRLRLPREENGEYVYPGEVEAINEAMYRRWIEKQLRSYSSARDASGEGEGYITGDNTEVYGIGNSPLGRHQGKMAETFPNLDADASWQNRPLTAESAFAVEVGSRYLRELGQFIGGDTTSYYLPYVPEPTVREAVALYELAAAARRGEGNTVVDLINDAFTNPRNPLYGRFRLHYVTVYEPGEKPKFIIEEPHTDPKRIEQLQQAHTRVLTAGLVTPEEGALPLLPAPIRGRLDDENSEEDREGSKYLQRTSSPVVWGVLTGGYFQSTFRHETPDDDADEYGTTDLRAQSTNISLTAGRSIDPDWLLGQYARRLVSEQRAVFEDSDTNATLPESLITRQYVQIEAFKQAGLLGEADDNDPRTTPIDIAEMPPQNINNRDDRLAQFIETHAALAEDPERRGAFLLGGLVGRIAAIQKEKGISRTVIEQHPIDSLTTRTVNTTLRQLLDKNALYSADSEQAGLVMNDRYISRLSEIMNNYPPDKWDLSTDDLRVHYGLGITYGKNDRSLTEDDESDSDVTDDSTKADDDAAGASTR